MRGLVQAVWVMRRTGLPDLARRAGLIGLLNPKLERAMELREGTPGPLLYSRLKDRPRPGAAGAGTAGSDAPLVGYWMSSATTTCFPRSGRPQ